MSQDPTAKNVIKFPARRSSRVIEATRSDGKQVLMALSLVSCVLAAVFANDQVLKTQRPIYIVSDNTTTDSLSRLNRAIASAQPLNPLRDLEWEHRLAERLGKNPQPIEERTPASFGRPVSALDQVRFGALGGKYRISVKSVDGTEKIEAIDYVDSLDSSDRPQHFDRSQFLSEYKHSFSVDFSGSELEGRHGQTEVYKLFDDSHRVVGKALVKLDEEEHFLALEFAR